MIFKTILGSSIKCDLNGGGGLKELRILITFAAAEKLAIRHLIHFSNWSALKRLSVASFDLAFCISSGFFGSCT